MGKELFKLDKNDFALLDFVKLSNQELKMILNWRNHDKVRRFMYKQHIITKQEHENFIKQLSASKKQKNFLVKKKDEYLGVITFDNLDEDDVYFGIYANPFSEILGIGIILNKLAIDYAANTLKKKKLMLEVMTNNTSVINLHKRFNFKQILKKEVHGFKVYVMQMALDGMGGGF